MRTVVEEPQNMPPQNQTNASITCGCFSFALCFVAFIGLFTLIDNIIQHGYKEVLGPYLAVLVLVGIGSLALGIWNVVHAPQHPPTPSDPPLKGHQTPPWQVNTPRNTTMPSGQPPSRTSQTSTLADFLALSPTQFEREAAALLQAMGYRSVRHVGKSGDLGADVTAYDISGNFVIVQCKKYAPNKPIGSGDMQKFIGMMHVHHKAQKGIFITTSTFTKPASQLAREHHILLIDGKQLGELAASCRKKRR